MWAALEATAPGRLRDVPNPRETGPGREGPAAQIGRGAYSEPREQMPGSEPGTDLNRERELGLDRRETG